MTSLAFVVACVSIYYLFARAEITRWLWSRYARVPFLDALARCPACSGTWIGAALALYIRPPTCGVGRWWEIPLWGALYGLTVTPLGTWALLLALDATSVPPPPPPPETNDAGQAQEP